MITVAMCLGGTAVLFAILASSKPRRGFHRQCRQSTVVRHRANPYLALSVPLSMNGEHHDPIAYPRP
jgi:hypothetical protein